MKDNIERRIIAIFVAALAILVFVAAMAVRNIRRSVASSDWVNHTHAVLLEIDGIVSSLHGGEAALRNYVLTGDARDQGAYREAYSEVTEHVEVAKALTKGEPELYQKVVPLEALVTQRIDFAREVVRAREQGGLEAARPSLAADAGSGTLGEIKRRARKIQDEAQATLRERDRASYLQAQTTRWTVLTGVAMNFLLLGLTAWLIRDDLAARRKAARILQEANETLEAKVKERTAELAAANQSLQAENLERQWANQALEHQLRYSQLTINAISEPIFVISKALNITRVNPAVYHASGWETTETVGKPLQRVLRLGAEAGADKPDPILRAMKEGRELHDRPAQLLSKDGQATPILFSLFPVRDQDKVVGGVVTARLSRPPDQT